MDICLSKVKNSVLVTGLSLMLVVLQGCTGNMNAIVASGEVGEVNRIERGGFKTLTFKITGGSQVCGSGGDAQVTIKYTAAWGGHLNTIEDGKTVYVSSSGAEVKCSGNTALITGNHPKDIDLPPSS